jgi:hypothetical protein
MRQGKSQWFVAAALALLVVAPLAFAGPSAEKGGDVTEVLYDGRAAYWRVVAEHEAVVLSIHTPCGTIERVYEAGKDPVFSIDELSPDDPNGAYTWQVRIQPVVSADVRKELARSRATGDEEIVRGLARKGLLPQGPFVQSGSFQVVDGVIVPPGDVEDGRSAKQLRAPASAAAAGVEVVTAADQVIPDDLIVQGSICVGFDCVNNESFGFDTIRLKENNTRIKFEDTSAGTFPSNDWQLTANDSASGGANKFSIEDITGVRVPFTIEAGSTTNSIYVDSTGRVGFRTATPVLDLHVSTTNTPGIRLEQTSAGGFTAQTWDIAGNEANFFVRDVTGGSRLPFRIRPGAPTSSIDINASGFVGIGTASPTRPLDVIATGAPDNTVLEIENDGAARLRINNSASGEVWNIGHQTPAGSGLVFSDVGDAVSEMLLDVSGNMTIAGTLTQSSSRKVKENFESVDPMTVLERVNGLEIPVWSYSHDDTAQRHMGPIAEEFHAAFGLGTSPEQIAISDTAGVALAAIQGLYRVVQEKDAQILALTERLQALETAVQQQQVDGPR